MNKGMRLSVIFSDFYEAKKTMGESLQGAVRQPVVCGHGRLLFCQFWLSCLFCCSVSYICFVFSVRAFLYAICSVCSQCRLFCQFAMCLSVCICQCVCHLNGQNRQSRISSGQRMRSTLAGHSAVPRGTNVTKMNANRAI